MGRRYMIICMLQLRKWKQTEEKGCARGPTISQCLRPNLNLSLPNTSPSSLSIVTSNCPARRCGALQGQRDLLFGISGCIVCVHVCMCVYVCMQVCMHMCRSVERRASSAHRVLAMVLTQVLALLLHLGREGRAKVSFERLGRRIWLLCL